MNKRSISTVLATLLTVLGLSFASFAEEQPPALDGREAELVTQYYGQCANTDDQQLNAIRAQLIAFLDMEIMAKHLADPAKFIRLMNLVNDPRTIHVMSTCATEPVVWEAWMRGATDFEKMGRTMAIFMNPGLYMNWMNASMQPASYQPMMKMVEPGYYNGWMTAMSNPSFYEPATTFTDPQWYTPRMNWMMNPRSYQSLFDVMGMGQFLAMFPAAQTRGFEPVL